MSPNFHKRAALSALAAAGILAGCNSSPTPGPAASSPVVPGSAMTQAFVPPTKPVYAPPTAKGDYASPADLAAALNAGSFECRLEGSPAGSITGSLGQTCWLPNNTDQVRIDIYTASEQQATSITLLKQSNWQVVEGNLWTVSALQPATAQAVADALK